MREFKERRRIRKLLYSKITIGFFVVVFFFIASAAWGVYGKYRETKENQESAGRELVKLQERKADIERGIERLESARGIEGEIRGKFGLVKDGEGVIIIVESPVSLGSETLEDKQGLFGAVLQSIIDIFR